MPGKEEPHDPVTDRSLSPRARPGGREHRNVARGRHSTPGFTDRGGRELSPPHVRHRYPRRDKQSYDGVLLRQKCFSEVCRGRCRCPCAGWGRRSLTGRRARRSNGQAQPGAVGNSSRSRAVRTSNSRRRPPPSTTTIARRFGQESAAAVGRWTRDSSRAAGRLARDYRKAGYRFTRDSGRAAVKLGQRSGRAIGRLSRDSGLALSHDAQESAASRVGASEDVWRAWRRSRVRLRGTRPAAVAAWAHRDPPGHRGPPHASTRCCDGASGCSSRPCAIGARR